MQESFHSLRKKGKKLGLIELQGVFLALIRLSCRFY